MAIKEPRICAPKSVKFISDSSQLRHAKAVAVARLYRLRPIQQFVRHGDRFTNNLRVIDAVDSKRVSGICALVVDALFDRLKVRNRNNTELLGRRNNACPNWRVFLFTDDYFFGFFISSFLA
jgi:hypothetical protein